jgi:hypothetical protein
MAIRVIAKASNPGLDSVITRLSLVVRETWEPKSMRVGSTAAILTLWPFAREGKKLVTIIRMTEKKSIAGLICWLSDGGIFSCPPIKGLKATPKIKGD